MTTPYGAPIPSTSPESPLSINFRIPEVPGSPQLTVRAGNGNELAGLTEDVAHAGVRIGHALTEFRAGFLAGSGLPAETPSAPVAAAPQPTYQAPPEPQYQNQGPPPAWAAPASPQAQYSVPAQPPQTGTAPAPSCPHGPRTYREGVSPKSGMPYKMWACTQPQGPSQCKPEWVK